eukprot:27186-Hanusia_phi.AAC.1
MRADAAGSKGGGQATRFYCLPYKSTWRRPQPGVQLPMSRCGILSFPPTGTSGAAVAYFI